MSSNINKGSSLTPPSGGRGATLFDKIWEEHIVKKIDDGPSVLYIDKHFIHEVTSPQALMV